jgi:hypothetical protein
MWTQAAIALQSALVAGAHLQPGHMTIGILLVLEVVGGIAASFAQPARQTLMPGHRRRAPTCRPPSPANSLCFATARFVGPAVAGPLIAVWGVVPRHSSATRSATGSPAFPAWSC